MCDYRHISSAVYISNFKLYFTCGAGSYSSLENVSVKWLIKKKKYQFADEYRRHTEKFFALLRICLKDG